VTTARGRHAPPPEVRLPLQRERLLRAAALEFAGAGFAGASSDSISRRAGMSKATFYEHFANKEECMLALFDMADHPEFVQTLLVEIIGAGPRAAQRRDRVLQAFAAVLDAENAAAARRGLIGRFRSPHDTFAVVGAITELVSRQVRLGIPAHMLDLAPVIDRLIFGLLSDEPAPA
jgi:AcrR family transcriptional regulator